MQHNIIMILFQSRLVFSKQRYRMLIKAQYMRCDWNTPIAYPEFTDSLSIASLLVRVLKTKAKIQK